MGDGKQSSLPFELAELLLKRAANAKPYLEFLRVPHLSAGVYVLPPGGVDAQTPHSEDELYLVLAGRAQLRVAGVSRQVRPGSLCFVKAHAAHAFHAVTEELRLLVVFGPAESTAS
jgi:mannose-6-phosphate isomerase-like protein (cupin superfamily)